MDTGLSSIYIQSQWVSLVWFLMGSKSFIDANDSAIDGAGVHHILQIIDEKRNPNKTDSKKQEYHQSYHPDHGTILIVDHSSHLCQNFIEACVAR